jgi:hypothetical protein
MGMRTSKARIERTGWSASCDDSRGRMVEVMVFAFDGSETRPR